MDAHPVRRVDTSGLAVEVLARRHQPARDQLVAQNVLLAVDVVEIHLQRAYPLGDAALEPRPFGGRDDPRHEIERERPLLAGQRERDALVDKRAPERIRTGGKLGRIGRRQLGVDALVRSPDGAALVEHLVERRGVRAAFSVPLEDSVELLDGL